MRVQAHTLCTDSVLPADDILLDFSKNRITEETLDKLLDVARESNLAQHIDRMFAGEKINFTEQRCAFSLRLAARAHQRLCLCSAVLHTALRNQVRCLHGTERCA